MEALADSYHWTFEDIKKMPKSEVDALIKIMSMKHKIQEVENKKLTRKK